MSFLLDFDCCFPDMVRYTVFHFLNYFYVYLILCTLRLFLCNGKHLNGINYMGTLFSMCI